MKKKTYLIVLLIAITLSCKKEKEVPFPVSENIKMTKEGYYEIGSIIKDGKNVVHLPNNETSWLQTPPDAPGYPSLANGYYFQEDL